MKKGKRDIFSQKAMDQNHFEKAITDEGAASRPLTGWLQLQLSTFIICYKPDLTWVAFLG